MPDPKILPFPDRKGQVKQEKRQRIQNIFDDALRVIGEDPGFKELAAKRNKEASEAELKAGPAAFRTGDLVSHVNQEGYPWRGRIMQFETEPDEPVHRLGPSYRENDIDGPGHYYNVNWYNPKLGQYHQDYVHQDNLRPYGVKKMEDSKIDLNKFWEDKRKAEALTKLTKALKYVEAVALKKMDPATNSPNLALSEEEEKKKKKIEMEKKAAAEEVEKCGEMTKPTMEKGCEMVKKSELLDRNDERKLLVKYGREKTDRILTAAAAKINGGDEMKKSEKLFEALSKAEEHEVKNIVYWRNRKMDAPSFVKE